MTLIPPHDPLLGALSMDEVYFDHEGPRFFSGTSRSGRRFRAVAVDEDESSDTYLYLPVSDARFGEIRSGALDLRTAFREPEDGSLFVVVADYEQPPRNRVSVVSPDEVAEDWLPLEGSRLQVPTATRPVITAEALSLEASQRGRTMLAVELDPADIYRTEYPLRSLARISRGIQDAVDALAQEAARRATARGAIPESILQEAELAFVESRAASFVLVLAPTSPPRLFEASLLVDASARMTELMEAGHDPESLSRLLAGSGPRARAKYRAFLEALQDGDSGASFWFAEPNTPPRTATLRRGEVRGSLELLRSTTTEVREIELSRASIIAVHLRRGTFELFDHALGRRYAGYMEPDARLEIAGLPTGDQYFYRATLLAEEQYSESTDEVFTEHRLRSISERTETSNP